MKRYKIWKASIDTYRVLDTMTGQTRTTENLVAVGCDLLVSCKAYLQAKANNFANSGRADDYFAWIAADKVVDNKERVLYPKRVFYNPFKSRFFRNRETNQIILSAKIITTKGNLLTYHEN